MQGSEHQVAGLGGRQRQADRFQVAQLAHQHHVRVLAQRRAQRIAERQCVRTDLALVDHALARFVHELDRILDRQDMAVQGVVHVIDHGGERGRLARSGRPGHQHQTARSRGEIREHPGRLQLFQRQHP